MKRMSRGLALTSLCLSLVACGSMKSYTLPADPNRASETQTMIGACATEYGLESYKGDNGIVSVKYDDTASLYYHYNDGDAFNLQVVVDDKKVPAPELEKKFSAAKFKGEDIYACAQMKLNPPPPAPVAVAPVEPAPAPAQQSGMSFQMNTNVNNNGSAGVSVSMNTTTTTATSTSTSASTSASVAMRGACAQAVECYAELAKTVCEGASNCSFKAKVSGNDEAGCRDALRRVPELIQPFSMMRPGLSAPAVCSAQ